MPRSIQSREQPSTSAIAIAVAAVICHRGFFSISPTWFSLESFASRLSSRALMPNCSLNERIRDPVINVFIGSAPYDCTVSWSSPDAGPDYFDGHPWDDLQVSAVDKIRKRIEVVRGDRRLSRSELSLKAGLSRNLVGQFVNGETHDITIGSLEGIARATKSTLDYLVSGRSDPAREKGLIVEAHPDPSFAQAAYAFLELYRCSEPALDVVARFLKKADIDDAPLSADEWFDDLRHELRQHRRRSAVRPR